MAWFNMMASLVSLLGSPLMCIADHSAHYGLLRLSSSYGQGLQGWSCVSLELQTCHGLPASSRLPDSLLPGSPVPGSRAPRLLGSQAPGLLAPRGPVLQGSRAPGLPGSLGFSSSGACLTLHSGTAVDRSGTTREHLSAFIYPTG